MIPGIFKLKEMSFFFKFDEYRHMQEPLLMRLKKRKMFSYFAFLWRPYNPNKKVIISLAAKRKCLTLQRLIEKTLSSYKSEYKFSFSSIQPSSL